jgi:hypothetical protein
MTPSTDDPRARRAAVVNGALVFGLPTAAMLVALVGGLQQPWPEQFAAARPGAGRVMAESAQFTLLVGALAVVAAWRTRVHAQRYQARQSRGWQGVGEAALCGFVIALLYLARGIVMRPGEAPPYIIFYGTAAAILGAIVGLVLRAIAVMVLRLSKSAPA